MLTAWLTAIATYGGLFPLVPGQGDPRREFHRRQAAGLYLFALTLAMSIFALVCVDFALSRTVGGLLEGQVGGAGLSLPYLILFAALVAAGGVVLALSVRGARDCAAGRTRPLPGIGGLMLRVPGLYGPLRASWFIGVALAVVAGITVGWGMNDRRATVHFLYTLRDPIPESLFRLSAVPLALSAHADGERFFAGPVTAENVDRAFDEGRFVVLGTHGMEMGFPTDDGVWVGPDGPPRSQLEQVYFGACRLGAGRVFWQRRFPNATIVGVDGLYHPMEGWFYLVFAAPRELGRRGDR